MATFTKEVAASAAKAAPPVGISIWQVVSDGLPHFVLWLTAIYTSIQIYVLVRDKILRRA